MSGWAYAKIFNSMSVSFKEQVHPKMHAVMKHINAVVNIEKNLTLIFFFKSAFYGLKMAQHIIYR